MFWVCRGARGKLCCRTEPTVCLPNATGPLDEPPGQRVGSCGLVVTLAVNRANSVVTVLSIIRTPARRARATQAASLVVWRPVHPGQLHGLRLRQRCQVRVEFVHRFIIVDRLLPAVIPATGFAPVLLITPTKRVRHRVSIGSVSRGSRWSAPALRSGLLRHRRPALPDAVASLDQTLWLCAYCSKNDSTDPAQLRVGRKGGRRSVSDPSDYEPLNESVTGRR